MEGEALPPGNQGFWCEVLILTLQLFSGHQGNYAAIEPRHRILEKYVTSFPLFSNPTLKVFTLKTLEFVCTGITGADPSSSLMAAVESWVAMCLTVLADAVENSDSDSDDGSTPSKKSGTLDDDDEDDLHPLALSVRALTATLLKLLEFDPNFSSTLVKNNFLDQYIYQILSKVRESASTGRG
jgi:hypothetical protein